MCNFGRVRELLKSPHSKGPDSGSRNIRKKSGAHDGKAMWNPDAHGPPETNREEENDLTKQSRNAMGGWRQHTK